MAHTIKVQGDQVVLHDAEKGKTVRHLCDSPEEAEALHAELTAENAPEPEAPKKGGRKAAAKK